jgi:hypothetical protein
MIDSQLTKEKVRKILAIPGKVKGVAFHTDAEYVLQKKGEAGLSKVEEELRGIGCPIGYKKNEATGWYPLGLRLVSLLAIKKAFDWSDKEIENMGKAAPKYSFIVKMLLKYFLTVEMTYKESPKYWVKHYTVGKIETPGYDLKKKYFLIRLKDLKAHPILCTYLGGYFVTLSQYLLKNTKDNKVKETKCMFKGDPYHEFLVTWK